MRALLGIAALFFVTCGAAHAAGDELLRAARDGRVARALTLAESGADVHRHGLRGETALHWAAFNGSLALVRALLARGAAVDARVDNGSTALHQAAYRGHLEVVEVLLANGATVGVVNRQGLTPAQLAQRNGHAAVLGLLVAHGAQPDPGDASGDAQAFRDVAARGHTGGASRLASSREIPAGPPASMRRADGGLRGMSTRLGELPPLVLKLPAAPAVTGAPLGLTRALGRPPSPAAAQRASQAPPRAPDDSRWIQLGSFRERANADQDWRVAAAAHADLMAGLRPTIVTIPLGARGTFHRLLVGPVAPARARRLCRALAARQRACLVIAEPGG